jgi:hypothetical protein
MHACKLVNISGVPNRPRVELTLRDERKSKSVNPREVQTKVVELSGDPQSNERLDSIEVRTRMRTPTKSNRFVGGFTI